jgi:hypothetical protein
MEEICSPKILFLLQEGCVTFPKTFVN